MLIIFGLDLVAADLTGVKGVDKMEDEIKPKKEKKPADLEKYKPIFPMIYLVISAGIAIGCNLLGIPEGVSGLLVGAALTRVKVPAPASDK